MAKDEPLKPDTEQQGRQVPLALDLLEPGSDDLQVERVSQKLPQGITAKMLYSDVVRIAWPSLIELTLTQLTSMVDLMMVGGLGPWAITAVGLSVQPRFLSMTMFIAMNVGATALVARYRGAGKPERANEVLRQALLLSLILSVLCGAAGYIYADRLIAFMGAADAETLAGGTVYLRIQMLTLPIFAVTSTITAALRGVGHTRVAMAYNIPANVVNVIFNYLLINGHYGFPLEVAGASSHPSARWLPYHGLHCDSAGRHYLHLRFRDGFRLQWQHLYNIFNIGIPSMIEQLAMRAGAIIYVRTVASLGTLAYATHQIGMNIQALSFMTGQAFAVSATSLVGQSLGKKRSDMAQSYSNHTRRLGLIISVILGIVFFFFGRQIVSLYTDEPEIIAQGARILKMVALVQPAQSSQFILAGALRGAGDTRATAVVTFLTVLLVRPSLAILAINGLGWGLDGAWVALLIDQLLRSGLILLRYRSGRWKKVRIK